MKIRNRIKKGFIITVILTGMVFTGCNNDDDDEELVGNWVRRSAFDGPARSGATSFIIGNQAYVTTGYTGDEFLNDLWVYNADGDFWEQKANFIGVKRNSASAFELNGKGYVGLGYDGTNRLKDFYEYDPTTNSWTQKADYAGSARYGAVGFQVGGKAYIGTGYDGNFQKDFYQYNPSTDMWTQANGFGGEKRRNAVVFVIGEKAYMGTGVNNNVNQIDFWEFDATTEIWTKKRNINRDTDDNESYNNDYYIVRANASSFVMNGLGYVCCGDGSNTVWEYNPSTDLWKDKTSVEASGRNDAVGFTINNRGYIMLGRTGTNYFDDLLEFRPNDTQVDND